MSWLTASAIAISLIPGVASWLSGIRLIRLRDDPALPERLQARSVLIGRVTAVAMVPAILLPGSFSWKLLLIVSSLILGDFPLRRRVLDERWGLGGYLRFLVQILIAVGGFWLILLFSPRLIESAEPWRWVAASGLAAILLPWSTFYTTMFVWIMRGRVFSPPPEFDRVTRLARIRLPLLVSISDPGGRLLNAFALPSLRRSKVVFTSTLLEILTVEEQMAVYAHEVAHLEEATRARLWRSEVRDVLAVLTATFGAAVLPGDLWFLRTPWPFMVLLWLVYMRARSRAGEERSDRRALELCGDPEALANALVKMSVYTRVPRRWDVDLEREATHPSLARRIQAIRRIAGTTEALMAPAAYALPLSGRFVIFAHDRLMLLEGVAPGTPIEPKALQANASRTREIPYAELIELRVKAGIRAAPGIVLTDRAGHVQKFPIRLSDVSSIQAILDRADLHLAPLPPPLRFELFLVRACAVSLLLFAAWSPDTRYVIQACAGLATVLPVPTSLAILAAASAAQALAVLMDLPLSVPRQPATALALFVAAIAFLWEMRRLIRRAVYRNKMTTVVLPLVLAVVFLVGFWTWIYAEEILDFGWTWLDNAVAIYPDAWIAPVALAGGLLSVRNRWAKVVAVLLLVCSIVLAVLGAHIVNIDRLFL